jgi:hypothetical protein
MKVCCSRGGAVPGLLRPSNHHPYTREDWQVGIGSLGMRWDPLLPGVAALCRSCGTGERGELGGPPRCEGECVQGLECLSVD